LRVDRAMEEHLTAYSHIAVTAAAAAGATDHFPNSLPVGICIIPCVSHPRAPLTDDLHKCSNQALIRSTKPPIPLNHRPRMCTAEDVVRRLPQHAPQHDPRHICGIAHEGSSTPWSDQASPARAERPETPSSGHQVVLPPSVCLNLYSVAQGGS
jgi:hypothetical protein